MNNSAAILTLTGQTTSLGRFVLQIDDFVVAMPRYRFLGLIVLINTKFSTLTGRAGLLDFESASVVYGKTNLHKLVERMRSDFDSFLGAGTGEQLVVHRGGSRYSLEIDSQQIIVAPDFCELRRDIPIDLYNDLMTYVHQSAAGLSQ